MFLNANESSNFTKNEELNRFFLQHTLISIIKQYESEFNRKLLTPLDRKKNRYFKFNVKAYLRADSATQVKFTLKQFGVVITLSMKFENLKIYRQSKMAINHLLVATYIQLIHH